MGCANKTSNAAAGSLSQEKKNTREPKILQQTIRGDEREGSQRDASKPTRASAFILAGNSGSASLTVYVWVRRQMKVLLSILYDVRLLAWHPVAQDQLRIVSMVRLDARGGYGYDSRVPTKPAAARDGATKKQGTETQRGKSGWIDRRKKRC